MIVLSFLYGFHIHLPIQDQETQAVGLNTTYAFKNFNAGNQSMNSTAGFATIAQNKLNTGVINANIHISTWNSTGINTAITNFLKNYSAVKATINTGILTNYTSITILGYSVGKISLNTNLTTNAAPVRNYMDNGIAAALKLYNLSLVDQNTSSIVAGAFAGDFYYSGMAVVPLIQNGMIVNPMTGQVFSNLQDAGFAAGSYISGGAVIVPQVQIVGWDFGTPIFASGSFLGSLTGSLTAAGQSVQNYFANGQSVISNEIGHVATTAHQYIVQPIRSASNIASSAISNEYKGFTTAIGNLSNTVMPLVGAIPADISNDISSGLGPIAGSLSNIKDSLGSMSSSITTAVAAGYSGLKQNVLTLGNYTTNALGSIKNTLGTAVAQDQAVLSSMYTSISNIPGQLSSSLASISSKIANSTSQSIYALLNSAGVFTAKNGSVSIGSVFGQMCT